MRVLIADDEAIIRLGLKAMLEEIGHEVVAAAPDGPTAVRLARSSQPDLVILDIKMPGLDGLAAAEAITAERAVPIVILSAYSDRDLVERAASLAVHAYLVKPIRPTELAPTLEIALGRFEESQALRREAQDLQQAMRARIVISDAKRVLMKRQGLSEAEAFRLIQERARQERRSMQEVGEEILAEQ